MRQISMSSTLLCIIGSLIVIFLFTILDKQILGPATTLKTHFGKTIVLCINNWTGGIQNF